LSSVTNINKCVLPVVNVGAVPLGHSTLPNQVTEPLVWVNSNVKAYARLDGGILVIVKVLLALIVLVK
jgi:hypothetical protein